jgi:hypothetical protein
MIIMIIIITYRYPNTPGAAIKDYWNIDDKTIVIIFDKGDGFNRKNIPTNFINLNLGLEIEPILSNQFWQRLVNKYGNVKAVEKVGSDMTILNTIQAITYCLENKECHDVPFTSE